MDDTTNKHPNTNLAQVGIMAMRAPIKIKTIFECTFGILRACVWCFSALFHFWLKVDMDGHFPKHIWPVG